MLPLELLVLLVLLELLVLLVLDPESALAGVAAAVSVDFEPVSESPPDFAASAFAASPAATGLPLLAPSSVFATGLLPLFLKSVAYQPEPFNWNPAAVNIFWNVSLPQLVQMVSRGSLTFCRNSFWNPQSLQRYS